MKVTCSTELIKKLSNYKLLPNKFSEKSRVLNYYNHCEVLQRNAQSQCTDFVHFFMFFSLWLIQLPVVLHFSFCKYWSKIPLWDTLITKGFTYIKGFLCFQNAQKGTQIQYDLDGTVHIQIQPESYAKQFYMVSVFIKDA